MIYFYTKNDEYGCFSNFSPHGIEMENKYWVTVEHYFQAQKFQSIPKYMDEIHRARTPKLAAQMGRSRQYKIREDWETVKDKIMFESVLKKFETHKKIKNILLSTGSKELVENAPGDYYWGCGADGSGKNKLGKILICVREKLQSNDFVKTIFSR